MVGLAPLGPPYDSRSPYPPMPYIDTHAHLDQSDFDPDREQTLLRSRQAGVEAVVCVGTTADSSEAAVRLAEADEAVYAAVGIQPNCVAEASPRDWERIVGLVDHPRVVAIGETGLDRYWDFTPIEQQEDSFVRHLDLAARRELPVLIHCRECETDVLAMLRQAAGEKPLRGILHAFSGTPAFAESCLELGLHLSFAGMVSYTNKKFRPLREIAKTVPEDRLLLETDSPYLVPHPLRGKQKRNEPAWIVHTAQALAELRDCPVEALAASTTANARRLFGLP